MHGSCLETYVKALSISAECFVYLESAYSYRHGRVQLPLHAYTHRNIYYLFYFVAIVSRVPFKSKNKIRLLILLMFHSSWIISSPSQIIWPTPLPLSSEVILPLYAVPSYHEQNCRSFHNTQLRCTRICF